MPIPTVKPALLEQTVTATGSLLTTIRLSDLPTAAKITASASMEPGPLLTVEVQVKNVIVLQVVTETIFPSNEDPHPPGGVGPALPQVVHRLVELRRSDGVEPVEAAHDNVVDVQVEVTSLMFGFRRATGMVVIKADTWQPREIPVPITLIEGTVVSVGLGSHHLLARQGESASTTLEVHWMAGVGAEICYELIHDASSDRIAMEPRTVFFRIEQLENKVVPITFKPALNCPPGRKLLRVSPFRSPGDEMMLSFQVDPAPIVFELPPQLKREILADHIHDRYLQEGGRLSRLGYPKASVEITGNDTARRQYVGGEIRAELLKLPGGGTEVRTERHIREQVRIAFIGWECVRKADSDQLSSADEPYFVVSVRSSNGSVATMRRFGPIEGVVGGTTEGVGEFIVSEEAPNPMTIQVIAYENDFGDPNETARKLQETAVQLAKQVQSVIASTAADTKDGPGIGPSAVAGGVAGVLAGPIGSLLAAGAVAALGLGDDFIGQNIHMLFRTSNEITTPASIGDLDGTTFNVLIPIDGGKEGAYNFFFDVVVEQAEAPIPI